MYNDVRKTEKNTYEPLVPELSTCEGEMATEELRRLNHKVLIKYQQNRSKHQVSQYVLRSLRENFLNSVRSHSLYPFIRKMVKTDCSNHRGALLSSTTNKILYNFLLS
jgi:hypothetical protein